MSFVAVLYGRFQPCLLAHTDVDTFPVKLEACPEAQPPLKNKHNRFWSNYQDVYTTWAIWQRRLITTELRHFCNIYAISLRQVTAKIERKLLQCRDGSQAYL